MKCDDVRLRTLLAVEEHSSEFKAAMEHIEHCRHCQSRIEELAAPADAWRESQAMLSTSHLSRSDRNRHSGDGLADRPWHRSRVIPQSTAWTDAMAKQLLSAPSHPEMLGRIGRFEVERLIGSGGMGIVFKAFDTELNRPVAVKVLAPHLAGNGSARQRFAREARAAAAVVHEHVVAIHNVDSSGVSPFLVMQYVAGESLQQRIDRDGPLELCETLRIAMQTAAGLAAAHSQGLVHRDVKPANILLEQGIERTLLTDFGLARAVDDASLTHTGYHPGTPQYMSPEQARGESVDTRSDLFSLGSVIYTMSTGRPPFRAESSYGVLRRITDNEPRSMREIMPNVPAWLELIVAKLHAKLPSHRFQSAEEVRLLFEQCLAHVQQPTKADLPKFCHTKPQPQIAEVRDSPKIPTSIAWSIGLLGLVVLGFVGRTLIMNAPQANIDGSHINGSHRHQTVESPSVEIDHPTDDASSIANVGNLPPQSETKEPAEANVPSSEKAVPDWTTNTLQLDAFGHDIELFENRIQPLWPNSQTAPKGETE